MAAHTAPRSWSLSTRLKAFTGHLELDRRLAAGEPPSTCVAIASSLLTAGTGPIFAPHPRGTLAEIAFHGAFLAEAG